MKSQQIFDVAGRRAVVTGAANGLGRAFATALADNGALVTLVDRNAEKLEGVVTDLRKAGGNVWSAVADVAQREELHESISAAAEKMGGLDVAFANAGIGGDLGFVLPDGSANPSGTIDGLEDQAWRRVVEINLSGAFNTLAIVAKLLKTQGTGGRIIVTTSVSATICIGFVGMAYNAAKAGARHMARQAARELAPYGINVNCIAPASFITNIGAGAMAKPEVQAAFAKLSPLGRCATTDEIQGLALLLASDASSFITGAEIPIDGGASLGLA
ncbi:MAG TPA: SDR family NAD(P)-dependent oxidoreductase [Steroidobacteraceae bacterium]|nr:SDR family NAD(P)-dependent oxidoreductase [Steroidobacteraceae bacterium]